MTEAVKSGKEGTAPRQRFFIAFPFSFNLIGNRGTYFAYIAAASSPEDRARSMALSGGGALIGLNVGPAVQMAFTWIGHEGCGRRFHEDLNVYGTRNSGTILQCSMALISHLKYANFKDKKKIKTANIDNSIIFILSALDDGLDRFDVPGSDSVSTYSIAAANDSDLERNSVKTVRLDVIAVVVCMLTRAARMLITSNIESIGSPFSEVMFDLDKTEVLDYNSRMQAAVGSLTTVMFLVYAFTDYSKWISERLNCLLAMIALLFFHILTFSWPFLPGNLSNCEKYIGNGSSMNWTWCNELRPVNMWLYYISYSIIFGIGLPCLNNSLQSLYSQILGKGRQGTMQGINQAVGCISRILGPLLMSTAFSTSGPKATWLIEIILISICLIVCQRSSTSLRFYMDLAMCWMMMFIIISTLMESVNGAYWTLIRQPYILPGATMETIDEVITGRDCIMKCAKVHNCGYITMAPQNWKDFEENGKIPGIGFNKRLERTMLKLCMIFDLRSAGGKVATAGYLAKGVEMVGKEGERIVGQWLLAMRIWDRPEGGFNAEDFAPPQSCIDTLIFNDKELEHEFLYAAPPTSCPARGSALSSHQPSTHEDSDDTTSAATTEGKDEDSEEDNTSVDQATSDAEEDETTYQFDQTTEGADDDIEETTAEDATSQAVSTEATTVYEDSDENPLKSEQPEEATSTTFDDDETTTATTTTTTSSTTKKPTTTADEVLETSTTAESSTETETTGSGASGATSTTGMITDRTTTADVIEASTKETESDAPETTEEQIVQGDDATARSVSNEATTTDEDSDGNLLESEQPEDASSTMIDDEETTTFTISSSSTTKKPTTTKDEVLETSTTEEQSVDAQTTAESDATSTTMITDGTTTSDVIEASTKGTDSDAPETTEEQTVQGDDATTAQPTTEETVRTTAEGWPIKIQYSHWCGGNVANRFDSNCTEQSAFMLVENAFAPHVTKNLEGCEMLGFTDKVGSSTLVEAKATRPAKGWCSKRPCGGMEVPLAYEYSDIKTYTVTYRGQVYQRQTSTTSQVLCYVYSSRSVNIV